MHQRAKYQKKAERFSFAPEKNSLPYSGPFNRAANEQTYCNTQRGRAPEIGHVRIQFFLFSVRFPNAVHLSFTSEQCLAFLV
ncbi:hypothetical protein, partial [uncultured Allobaculum sp.]|uniref:hypothetical protein n=1 Tax=uncultured Allobaculum sp. TaxID=1187017 RepID=UPI0026381B1B